jgi:hypothetical protein
MWRLCLTVMTPRQTLDSTFVVVRSAVQTTTFRTSHHGRVLYYWSRTKNYLPLRQPLSSQGLLILERPPNWNSAKVVFAVQQMDVDEKNQVIRLLARLRYELQPSWEVQRWCLLLPQHWLLQPV